MNTAPVTVSLTQDEMLLISNALLRTIADNCGVAHMIIGIEDDKIVRQIADANETLRNLNSKICKSMTE